MQAQFIGKQKNEIKQVKLLVQSTKKNDQLERIHGKVQGVEQNIKNFQMSKKDLESLVYQVRALLRYNMYGA